MEYIFLFFLRKKFEANQRFGSETSNLSTKRAAKKAKKKKKKQCQTTTETRETNKQKKIKCDLLSLIHFFFFSINIYFLLRNQVRESSFPFNKPSTHNHNSYFPIQSGISADCLQCPRSSPRPPHLREHAVPHQSGLSQVVVHLLNEVIHQRFVLLGISRSEFTCGPVMRFRNPAFFSVVISHVDDQSFCSNFRALFVEQVVEFFRRDKLRGRRRGGHLRQKWTIAKLS